MSKTRSGIPLIINLLALVAWKKCIRMTLNRKFISLIPYSWKRMGNNCAKPKWVTKSCKNRCDGATSLASQGHWDLGHYRSTKALIMLYSVVDWYQYYVWSLWLNNIRMNEWNEHLYTAYYQVDLITRSQSHSQPIEHSHNDKRFRYGRSRSSLVFESKTFFFFSFFFSFFLPFFLSFFFLSFLSFFFNLRNKEILCFLCVLDPGDHFAKSRPASGD